MDSSDYCSSGDRAAQLFPACLLRTEQFLVPLHAGTVALDCATLRVRNPHEAIQDGLALVTEDRKNQGLVLGITVRENVTLPHLEEFVLAGRIDRGEEGRSVAKPHRRALQRHEPTQDPVICAGSGVGSGDTY